MSRIKILALFFLPILVSLILHLRIFKYDVIGYHVWRQSQTQTVIYHFSKTDNNIFHPQKFDIKNGSTALLYEFPLYQWLIAQVNRATSYSVFNSRIFSFIVFIFFLAGFFLLIRRFVSPQIALFTNALVCFSPLLYYYCVNPLPDLMALALATWSLVFFFRFLSNRKAISFLFFSLLLSLATLVKLPYVIFGSITIPVFIDYIRMKRFRAAFGEVVIICLPMVPPLLWYLHAIPTWQYNPVLKGITEPNKSALELLDYMQFTLISSFPELLTNYASCIFAFTGIYFYFKNFRQYTLKYKYFFSLFIAVCFYYLFEMSAIEKVHDYYLLPFIPLIFLVVTFSLKRFYEGRRKWLVYLVAALVPLTAWLRIDHRWNPETPGFVVDYLSRQDSLQKIIPTDAKCIIDYDDSQFVSLYYLKRYGFSLGKPDLNPETLRKYYCMGGDYLVSENLSLNLNAFPDFSFEELYSGQLKIYKLKLK